MARFPHIFYFFHDFFYILCFACCGLWFVGDLIFYHYLHNHTFYIFEELICSCGIRRHDIGDII